MLRAKGVTAGFCFLLRSASVASPGALPQRGLNTWAYGAEGVVGSIFKFQTWVRRSNRSKAEIIDEYLADLLDGTSGLARLQDWT